MKYGAVFFIRLADDTMRETLWWDFEDDRDEDIYRFEAEMNGSGARILHIQGLSIACDSLIAIKKVERIDDPSLRRQLWAVKGVGLFKTKEEAEEARRKAGLDTDEEEWDWTTYSR